LKGERGFSWSGLLLHKKGEKSEGREWVGWVLSETEGCLERKEKGDIGGQGKACES